MSKLSDAMNRLHETSERAPDVRSVPMRLVRQDAYDDLIAEVVYAKRASSAELVREVVREAVHAEFDRHDNSTIQDADWNAMCDAIADRAVELLAVTAEIASSAEIKR